MYFFHGRICKERTVVCFVVLDLGEGGLMNTSVKVTGSYSDIRIRNLWNVSLVSYHCGCYVVLSVLWLPRSEKYYLCCFSISYFFVVLKKYHMNNDTWSEDRFHCVDSFGFCLLLRYTCRNTKWFYILNPIYIYLYLTYTRTQYYIISQYLYLTVENKTLW